MISGLVDDQRAAFLVYRPTQGTSASKMSVVPLKR